MSQGFTKGTPIDTDPTLSLNSDIVVPSQKAVKSYLASNYQPTLTSGTNIKTINGNTLLGSGDLTIGGGGLTVGTTAIASGTIGRILFENGGNVLGQDSALFWDNTNKRLGIGATPSTSVRLDVRAQGALSTDIAFRVRNSANSVSLLDFQGTGNLITRHNSSGSSLGLFHRSDTTGFSLTTGVGGYGTGTGIEVQGTNVWLIANNGARGFKFSQAIGAVNNQWNFEAYPDAGYGNQLYIYNNKAGSESYILKPEGRIVIGYDIIQPNGTLNLAIKTGTAPTQGLGDGFVVYSADITAGNAAPHFRTENGNIIKLYQQSSTGITTVGQLVTVLQNLGLLS